MSITSPVGGAPRPAVDRSPFEGLDLCATLGLAVDDGARGPVFDEDVWDFSPVVGLPAYLRPVARRLDFTAIRNPAWRIVAKEYAVALLAPHLDQVRELPGAYRTPRGIQTCVGRHVELVHWLNWLTEQQVASLQHVTAEMCERFAAERGEIRDEHGAVVAVSTGALHNAVSAVSGLALYRELFAPDHRYPSALRPFGGATAAQVSGKRTDYTNRTPVVQEEVLQPLLTAALYVSTTLAGPIAQFARERVPSPRRPQRRTVDAARLRAVIAGRAERNEPLELLHPSEVRKRLDKQPWRADDPLIHVNLAELAHEVDVDWMPLTWLDRLRPELEAAVNAVGLVPPLARNAEVVERADGTGSLPWTEPLFFYQAAGIPELLRFACLVVTAAVSGMRRSELVELLPGCRMPVEEPFPGLRRYRVAGTLIKGQPVGGTREQWVVTEHVHTAIAAVEQLGEDGPLFPNMVFDKKYAAFRTWGNGPRGQRLGLAPIPDGPVNLRMLRRTLAVALAYRPHGVLAAKIQLKHVSVATTEGYAGSPGGAQARFLADVAREEEQRTLELLTREHERYRAGARPAGPGARGLANFFAALDTAPKPPSGTPANVIDNDQRVRAMLARRAKTLHLGAANYCWFSDPAQALCLKTAGTPQAEQPVLGLCEATRCPQSTFHPVHRAIWQDAAEQHERFLSDLPRSRTVERRRLEQELLRVKEVLSRIDEANPEGIAAWDD